MAQETQQLETLDITDPATGRIWEIPRRLTRNIMADVAERWVANIEISEDVCHRIVTPPFLEPIPVNGRHILSLCAIFMRHAAPTWAPLQLGPPSHNCALRVACIDQRDASQAVWVDHRYTDSHLAGALSKLGFAPVRPHLVVSRHPRGGKQHLGLRTLDGDITLNLIETSNPTPQIPPPPLFHDRDHFADYFLSGVRSYGPTDNPDQFTVVDLTKLRIGSFKDMSTMRGTLKTPWGTHPCNSVYRSRNSLYRWHYVGEVDRTGLPTHTTNTAA